MPSALLSRESRNLPVSKSCQPVQIPVICTGCTPYISRGQKHFPSERFGDNCLRTLQNPYLREFETFVPQDDFDRNFGKLRLRLKYVWAVPTDEAIERMSEFSPIIEIGAGAGYWAWCARQFGVEIVAFDCEVSPPGENLRRALDELHFTEVLEGDENKICDYPNHTLFLVYPPSKVPPLGIRCLNLYKRRHLLYAGPPWRSHEAAGDAWFHAELENKWRLLHRIALPSDNNADDALCVYESLPTDQHRNIIPADEIFVLEVI